ncbi:amino acid transport GAP1 [Fusarium albosuccineum]|uniref:Amino acid transport GAP1 n=1 Tax=Fusarium albosuccineum TaxID=1237068 RepID=A0A8H4PEE0_9HYPO|nr:amino acid transport GAP1 [Fusarium albosuccineum]
MSHEKSPKTTDITVEVALTRDVEIIEMRNMVSTTARVDETNMSWAISAPKPDETKEQGEWYDGFRRADRRKMKRQWDQGYEPEQKPAIPGDRHYDIRAANARTATSALARELKGRHLQMIAFGGTIAMVPSTELLTSSLKGTGLFVTSGSALHAGGPGSVLLSYIVIGMLQYCTMQSLAELSVMFPIAGSFSAFSTRFLDPSWGFAMGWNYCLQWLFTLPLEIIAGAFTIRYWNEHLSQSVFVGIFLAAIVVINLPGVKAYGEAEFIFSIIKITAIVGFILLAIVINIGGEPTSGYIGGRYWMDPGLFNNGFKGFCSVLVTSCFSFTGTELIGLAAAETANPRKSIPSAIKQVFWRIAIFYVVSLLLVSLLVAYDDPRITHGTNIADASASPFVVAIETAGTTVLPSVMNAVILIAVISVGNSAVFGSSRTLAALADQSQAPAIFAYVDKQGRPLAAIVFSCTVGLLAFLAEVKSHGVVFDWLLSISSLATLFTWGSICLTHIRFRNAWAHASHTLEQLPFRARSGTTGAWFALSGYVLILASQVWMAVSPVDADKNSTLGDVQNFFLQSMAIPIVVVFYLGHKIWYRTSFVSLNEIDITTGRRYYRVHLMSDQEREARVAWPFWKKVYKYFC